MVKRAKSAGPPLSKMQMMDGDRWQQAFVWEKRKGEEDEEQR